MISVQPSTNPNTTCRSCSTKFPARFEIRTKRDGSDITDVSTLCRRCLRELITLSLPLVNAADARVSDEIVNRLHATLDEYECDTGRRFWIEYGGADGTIHIHDKLRDQHYVFGTSQTFWAADFYYSTGSYEQGDPDGQVETAVHTTEQNPAFITTAIVNGVLLFSGELTTTWGDYLVTVSSPDFPNRPSQMVIPVNNARSRKYAVVLAKLAAWDRLAWTEEMVPKFEALVFTAITPEPAVDGNRGTR